MIGPRFLFFDHCEQRQFGRIIALHWFHQILRRVSLPFLLTFISWHYWGQTVRKCAYVGHGSLCELRYPVQQLAYKFYFFTNGRRSSSSSKILSLLGSACISRKERIAFILCACQTSIWADAAILESDTFDNSCAAIFFRMHFCVSLQIWIVIEKNMLQILFLLNRNVLSEVRKEPSVFRPSFCVSHMIIARCSEEFLVTHFEPFQLPAAPYFFKSSLFTPMKLRCPAFAESRHFPRYWRFIYRWLLIDHARASTSRETYWLWASAAITNCCARP